MAAACDFNILRPQNMDIYLSVLARTYLQDLLRKLPYYIAYNCKKCYVNQFGYTENDFGYSIEHDLCLLVEREQLDYFLRHGIISHYVDIEVARNKFFAYMGGMGISPGEIPVFVTQNAFMYSRLGDSEFLSSIMEHYEVPPPLNATIIFFLFNPLPVVEPPSSLIRLIFPLFTIGYVRLFWAKRSVCTDRSERAHGKFSTGIWLTE